MKTIDVWISDRILDGDDVTVECRTYESGYKREIKMQLIVPEEKEITISNNTFDYVTRKLKERYPTRQVTVEMVMQDLKEELGFGD